MSDVKEQKNEDVPKRKAILMVSPDSQFHVTSTNEICTIYGNGVGFVSASVNRDNTSAPLLKEWIQNPIGTCGIACLAADVASGLIAFSPRGYRPHIYVHSIKTKEHVITLGGGGSVEYSTLTFSRNGFYLVAVGGQSDGNSIYLWDVKSGTKIRWTNEIAPTTPRESTFCSFDPLDKRVVCIGGMWGLGFLHIEQDVGGVEGNLIVASVVAENKSSAENVACVDKSDFWHMSSSDSLKDDKNADLFSDLQALLAEEEDMESQSEATKRLCLTGHCWDSKRNVWAANILGEILCFNKMSGQLVRTIFSKTSARVRPSWIATSIEATQKHLILGCDDGCLRWISLDFTDNVENASATVQETYLLDIKRSSESHDEGKEGDLMEEKNKDEESVPPILPLSVHADPSFRCLFAVGDEGSIFRFPLLPSVDTFEANDNDDNHYDAATTAMTTPLSDASSVLPLTLKGPSTSTSVNGVGEEPTALSMVTPQMLHKGEIDPVVAMVPLGHDDESNDDRIMVVHQQKLSLWNCERGTQSSVKHLDLGMYASSEICDNTCADIYGATSLVAIGGSNGVVRLIAVDDGDWVDLHEEQVHTGAILQVVFHDSKPFLVSRTHNEIVVLDCSPSKSSEPEIVGICALNQLRADDDTGDVTCVSWKSDAIVVAFDDGTMATVTVPESNERESPAKSVPKLSCGPKLNVQTETDILMANACGPNEMLTASKKSKSIRLYRGVRWNSTASGRLDCDARIESDAIHNTGISCAALCRGTTPSTDVDGARIGVAGSRDGQLAAFRVSRESGGALSSASIATAHGGSVQHCAITHSGRFAVSSGADGSVVLWTLPATFRAPNKKLSTFSCTWTAKDARAELRGLTASKRAEIKFQEDCKKKAVSINASNAKELKRIKDKMDALVVANEKMEPLDQLERSDFCIDIAGRQLQQTENKRIAENVRRSLQFEMSKMELISQRIKKDVVDNMRVVGQACVGFEDPASLRVRNFPIRRLETKKIRQREVALRMRRLELILRDERKRSIPEVSANVSYLLNQGQLLPGPKGTVRGPVEVADMRERTSSASKYTDGSDSEETSKAKDSSNENDNEAGQTTQSSKADRSSGRNGDDDGNFDTVGSLLHAPVALKTERQRRVHILLLERYCEEMKEAFNRKFEALFARKEGIVESIVKEKNVRIRQIIDELKIASESPEAKFVKPQYELEEQPEKLVRVDADEVPFEKYITEAERLRLEREEQRETRRRQARLEDDDAPKRALMDMMNGSLEKAKGLSALEITIERASWMDEVSPEDMTEEQKVEMDKFETESKRLEEEREKYKKALGLELKKLKTDVVEMMRSFDDRLKALRRERETFRARIASQELYITLVKLMSEDVRSKSRLRSSIATFLSILGDLKQRLSKRHAALRVACDSVRDDLQYREKDLAAMKAAFKVEVQKHIPRSLDHDTLKILSALYSKKASEISVVGGVRGGRSRSRRISAFSGARSGKRNSTIDRSGRRTTMQGGGSGVRSASGRRQSSGVKLMSTELDVTRKISRATDRRLDPSGGKIEITKEEAMARLSEDALRPLPASARPEEISKDLWQRTNRLRLDRIRKELEIKSCKIELATLSSRNRKLAGVFDSLCAEMEDLAKRRTDLSNEIRDVICDVHVVLSLSQGRDEVSTFEKATDAFHPQAILIASRIVLELNSSIKAKAKEKVQVLEKIKEYRKTINFIQWEHSYMTSQKMHLEALYVDFHMLRVTKKMQHFFDSDKKTDPNAEKLDQANKKFQYMEDVMKKDKKKFDRDLKSLRRKTAAMSGENAQRREEIQKMRRVLMQQERAKTRSGDDKIDKDRVAQRKMQMIVNRRKLIDLARTQTDEIDYLRQALAQLRERSFPVFGRSAAPLNPDERE